MLWYWLEFKMLYMVVLTQDLAVVGLFSLFTKVKETCFCSVYVVVGAGFVCTEGVMGEEAIELLKQFYDQENPSGKNCTF
jgi:hypothetical protein